MASVRAGVVTGVEVNSPMVTMGTGGNGKLFEDSPATWAMVLFVAALIILFFFV